MKPLSLIGDDSYSGSKPATSIKSKWLYSILLEVVVECFNCGVKEKVYLDYVPQNLYSSVIDRLAIRSNWDSEGDGMICEKCYEIRKVKK